jgi:hypothetical protein
METTTAPDLPSTIDEVLAELDSIIEQSRQENDYIGLFAYVYRRTTAAIQQGIVEDVFEDGPRMEHFDVYFANLYIQAHRNFRAQQPTSSAWQICFDARFIKMTALQHVLMGMNAHINLDLGIAAASTSEGPQLLQMKNDFNKVNDILNSIIDEIQASLGKISPFLFLLDWMGGRKDEKLVEFGIRRFREQAWQMACELALALEENKAAMIEKVDKKTTQLSHAIQHPPHWGIRLMCSLISVWEEKSTAKILDRLIKKQKTNQQILAKV